MTRVACTGANVRRIRKFDWMLCWNPHFHAISLPLSVHLTELLYITCTNARKVGKLNQWRCSIRTFLLRVLSSKALCSGANIQVCLWESIYKYFLVRILCLTRNDFVYHVCCFNSLKNKSNCCIHSSFSILVYSVRLLFFENEFRHIYFAYLEIFKDWTWPSK